MSPASPVSPEVVRALVREALEQRLGIRPALVTSQRAKQIHPSLAELADGAECSDETDFSVQKPCLIEPHRPCYHSGYCRKLGH